MIISDSITLDASGLKLTKDGYLVGDAKVSRASNVQQYYGFELGMNDERANEIFGVYRDPEVVFDTESMMSLAGRPVTRGHPETPVTSENWKDLAIGQVGGVIRRDGEHVVAPMAIMDASAAQEVINGARGLSAGYTVQIVAQDGVAEDGTPYQFKQAGKLRFNHVAYLPNNNPRAGNTRLGDQDFQPGGKPTTTVGGHSMSDQLKTVVLGDKAVQVAVSDVAAIEQFKADSAKALADAESKHNADIEAKDKEIGELKAELKEAKDAANIDVDALVSARSELINQIKAIDSKIETKGKTDDELRKAAVVAKYGDEMVDGMSDAAIEGMFKVLSASRPKNPVADAFKNGINDADSDINDAQKAYVDRLTRKGAK